jgi:hypothetical protein
MQDKFEFRVGDRVVPGRGDLFGREGVITYISDDGCIIHVRWGDAAYSATYAPSGLTKAPS